MCVGAVGAVVALHFVPQADAADPGSSKVSVSADSAAQAAIKLKASLGSSYGGAYYDAGKRELVVNVTDLNDRIKTVVEKSGAVARSVRNSLTDLESAEGTLTRRASIPGTAWAIDPKSNRLVITADRTVSAAQWGRLEATVESLGAGTARLSRLAGSITPLAAGGDAILSDTGRCSLAFNVTAAGGQKGFMTAGHCGGQGVRWSDRTGVPLGVSRISRFPGQDFAFVPYNDPSADAPAAVNVGGGRSVRITRAADAAVGMQVMRMGSTTGLKNGQVTGLNATVNYPQGTVTGLIQTNLCAERGDSGGPLFTADGSALGIASGGSASCAPGDELTFFQPVTQALAAVGAQLVTARPGADEPRAAGGEAPER
ncbi:S1 family peptidase [Streptomyces sp. NPDC090073]|uniref:S1 family peptidase n=1 Tax=Streptomyces sp. NPDC090073 TaxID=3365936 RepID=UPI00380E1B06